MITDNHTAYYAWELIRQHARDLERRRNEKRRYLFETQDEVDFRKATPLGVVEAWLKQQVELKPLFTVRWRLM